MKPQSAIGLLSVSLLCAILTGCGQSYKGDQRYAVSGKVTYDADGEVIDVGTISFIPMSGDKQRVSGGLIENGAYTITEEMGPNAGQYRVEIRWAKKTGEQFPDPATRTMIDRRNEGLPPKFHKDSILTADVSAAQTKFDFDLKSE